MEIKVKIPDEIAARAKERGLKLETYVEEILAQQLRPETLKPAQTWNAEQIRGWLDSLAQFSEKIPPLPKTISREWIYEEHN